MPRRILEVVDLRLDTLVELFRLECRFGRGRGGGNGGLCDGSGRDVVVGTRASECGGGGQGRHEYDSFEREEKKGGGGGEEKAEDPSFRGGKVGFRTSRALSVS